MYKSKGIIDGESLIEIWFFFNKNGYGNSEHDEDKMSIKLLSLNEQLYIANIQMET